MQQMNQGIGKDIENKKITILRVSLAYIPMKTLFILNRNP